MVFGLYSPVVVMSATAIIVLLALVISVYVPIKYKVFKPSLYVLAIIPYSLVIGYILWQALTIFLTTGDPNYTLGFTLEIIGIVLYLGLIGYIIYLDKQLKRKVCIKGCC